VPVKDRYRHNSGRKRKIYSRGVISKNAASGSALRRVGRKIRKFGGFVFRGWYLSNMLHRNMSIPMYDCFGLAWLRPLAELSPAAHKS